VVPTQQHYDSVHGHNSGQTPSDPTGMGRFSYHKITGANGNKIIFIAAYGVCKDYIASAGENTSFFHQWHELIKQGH
jgi:hypothetical protein